MLCLLLKATDVCLDLYVDCIVARYEGRSGKDRAQNEIFIPLKRHARKRSHLSADEVMGRRALKGMLGRGIMWRGIRQLYFILNDDDGMEHDRKRYRCDMG